MTTAEVGLLGDVGDATRVVDEQSSGGFMADGTKTNPATKKVKHAKHEWHAWQEC
jgi:hypothetical protein